MNECCCEWYPKFTDSSGMEIDLGSDVKPVIGVANDYNLSDNKPSINGVVLIGNKTNEELQIRGLTNKEIEDIINSFV